MRKHQTTLTNVDMCEPIDPAETQTAWFARHREQLLWDGVITLDPDGALIRPTRETDSPTTKKGNDNDVPTN